MVSRGVRTGFPIVKGNRSNNPQATFRTLLLDLKSYVKYTTLPSHIGILMIIYGFHNVYF